MYDLQVASLRTTTIKHWPNLNEARLRALLKDHRSVGTGDAAWFLNGPEKHIREKITMAYPRGPHCNPSNYSVSGQTFALLRHRSIGKNPQNYGGSCA